MRGYVQNEYVHVDFIKPLYFPFWKVFYEPLEYPLAAIVGEVCWTNKTASIYTGGRFPHCVYVDCDNIAVGDYDRQTRRITLSWLEYPEEHFLCLSGEMYDPERPRFWLKEGF